MATIREVIDHLICAPLRYDGKNRQVDSETLRRIIHKMQVALINFPLVVRHNIYRVKQRRLNGLHGFIAIQDGRGSKDRTPK
jgi:hypothetical protein